MEKISSILRAMVAVATVLLLAFLAWNCMDIYLNGAETSTLEAVFNYEEVTQRVKGLALPGILYVSLIVVTVLLQRMRPISGVQRHTTYSHKAACQEAAVHAVTRGILRWGFLIAAITLVVWGMVNGGLYDVLVKSINICTECIGLG